MKLANACGLRYPGARAQTQKRERLIADLVRRAGQEETIRKTVLRTLRKETALASNSWEGLGSDQKWKRIRDEAFLREGGNLGLTLLLLAQAPADPVLEDALPRLLSREDLRSGGIQSETPSQDPEALAREASHLRKKSAELQKKIQHLEGQLTRNRETEKALKRDVIQRKGELAESRMLAERLRKELQEAKGAAKEIVVSKETPTSDPLLEEVARALRKTAGEQRKLLHHLEKEAETPPPAPTLPPDSLAPVLRAIEELQKETAALRRERRKDQHDQAKRLEGLQAEVKAVRAEAEGSPSQAKAGRRRKGEPERVGVFIDVQNMYYAARQLKGKLDFDALLQASVLDRRLIKATAYVVETKEIDQSGFIAMLEQRAIEVRRKNVKVRADGSMKGDWDMEMALDILDSASKLDVVVLVSGDGDFTSLVNRIKGMGPRVEVIGFPRNTAKSLLEAADRYQPLDKKFVIRSDIEPLPARIRRAPPAAQGPTDPTADDEGERGPSTASDQKESAVAAVPALASIEETAPAVHSK